MTGKISTRRNGFSLLECHRRLGNRLLGVLGLRNKIFAILGAFSVALSASAAAAESPSEIAPSPVAQSPAVTTGASVSADARDLIDLIAADFYEHRLAAAQAAAIEDLTAARYRALTERDRKAFLRERAAAWRAMGAAARERAKNAARPRFENLTEEQKTPFRSHARRFLYDAADAAPNRREI
jgi:hypothetical protein